MSAAMDFFSKGLKTVFEIAVANEPSVFEPLKFYCILMSLYRIGFEKSQIAHKNSISEERVTQGHSAERD